MVKRGWGEGGQNQTLKSPGLFLFLCFAFSRIDVCHVSELCGLISPICLSLQIGRHGKHTRWASPVVLCACFQLLLPLLHTLLTEVEVALQLLQGTLPRKYPLLAGFQRCLKLQQVLHLLVHARVTCIRAVVTRTATAIRCHLHACVCACVCINVCA